MTALLTDDLTGTEWLRTIAASNPEAFEQIKTMTNEEGYPLCDILEFVNDYGLNAFTDGHYHTWCELEETYERSAIEAYIEAIGIDALGEFEDAYVGEFSDEQEFAEVYFTELCGSAALDDAIRLGLVIDWEATWEGNLRFDFTFEGGYIFRNN